MKYIKFIIAALLLSATWFNTVGQEKHEEMQSIYSFPQLFKYCENNRDFETISISKEGINMLSNTKLDIEQMYKITSTQNIDKFKDALTRITQSGSFNKTISLSNGNENLEIYTLRSDLEIRKNRHEYICITQNKNGTISVVYICGNITLEQIKHK